MSIKYQCSSRTFPSRAHFYQTEYSGSSCSTIMITSWTSSPWAPSYQKRCWRQWSPRQSGFSSLLEQYLVQLQVLSLSIEENVLINNQIPFTNQEVLGNRRSHLESLLSHPDTKSLLTLSSVLHFWHFCCITTTRPVQDDLQVLTSQVG